MVYWMSDNTNRVLDEHGIVVYGFDPEKDGEDARCSIEWGEDKSGVLPLGDVRHLTDVEIDRRFASAVKGLALAENDEELAEVADLLLLPYLTFFDCKTADEVNLRDRLISMSSKQAETVPSVGKEMDMPVTIHCGGFEQKWCSLWNAYQFYLGCAYVCEGSESDRYWQIVNGLEIVFMNRRGIADDGIPLRKAS